MIQDSRERFKVEEVLDLGGTEAELAEAMDVGLLMGGTLAVKAVRHAYEVLDELRGGGGPGADRH